MSPNPAGAPAVPGYETLELIATSGTVEVYRGRHRTLGREVAIKVLRPGLPTPDWSGRFLDGVRIMASLEHSGIPSAHELGELPDGRPFVVMKLVGGAPLASLLDGRPDTRSDLDRFARVFRQVSEAVGFAHSRGVVHRNIKSRNVMVGESGEAQLISWSLATFPGAVTQEELLRYPSRTGVVVGTPTYIPPEQARGQPADERSDVFGLGGVLCHILTGEPPFRAVTDMVGLLRVAAAGDLRDAFARLDACGADPELVSLCKRCLAPRPEDRPADGQAVAELAGRVIDSG